MTKEEFKQMFSKIRKKTMVLAIEKRGEMYQYIRDHSPFQIGDKIEFKGRKGIIDYVVYILGDFEYSWRPYEKNGSLGSSRKIEICDNKYIIIKKRNNHDKRRY